MKTKSQPNKDRLTQTMQAILNDTQSFNPALWTDSKKTQGDFAWFAVNLFGTKEQRDKFTWEDVHFWVGKEILGLSKAQSEVLFWGGITLLETKRVVKELCHV